MTAIEKKKKELDAQKFGKMILDKTISAEKSWRLGGAVQDFTSNGSFCTIYSAPKVGRSPCFADPIDVVLSPRTAKPSQ